MDEIERILKDLEETRRRRYFYWEKLIVIDVFRISTDYSDYPLTPLAWRPSGEVTYLYGDDATSLIFGDMYRALRKEGIPLEVEVALEGKKVKRIKSMRPLDAISIDAFLRRLRELVEKKVPKGSYY